MSTKDVSIILYAPPEDVNKSRREIAKLIKYASDNGAKAVVLDMVMIKDGDPKVDNELIEAVKYADKKGCKVFFAAGLVEQKGNGYEITKESNAKFKKAMSSGHICSTADIPKGANINDYDCDRVPIDISGAKPLAQVVLEKIFPDMKLILSSKKDRNGTPCYYYDDMPSKDLSLRTTNWNAAGGGEEYKKIGFKDQFVFVGGDYNSDPKTTDEKGKMVKIPGVNEIVSEFLYFSKYMKKK